MGKQSKYLGNPYRRRIRAHAIPEQSPLGDLSESEDGDNLSEWDDEKTLVTALMQEDSHQHSERDKLIALANKLRNPMSAQSLYFKKYFAQVLVPALRSVKQVGAILDENVDMDFARGLIAFDDSCKNMERRVIEDNQVLTTTYYNAKKTIENLFSELEQAYARRDKILSDLKQSINQSAEQILAQLNEIPLIIERKIDELERQAKELENENDETAKAQEKMLREFFGKLA